MQDFRITRIGEDIYHILDSGNSSFYVVEGQSEPPSLTQASPLVGRFCLLFVL